MFEQVQAQLRRFKSEKKNTSTYPLRGKVFCGCCNHALNRNKKEAVFSCKHTLITDSLDCHGYSIEEKELESLLFEIVSKQAEIILGLDCMTDIHILKTRLSEKCGYESLIKNCKDGKVRLYEQYLLGEIDESEYRELKKVYDAELADLNSFHAALSFQTAQMITENEKTAKLQVIATDVVDEKSLTRELVETLIDKIEVFPDNRIEIAWKIEDFMSVESVESAESAENFDYDYLQECG